MSLVIGEELFTNPTLPLQIIDEITIIRSLTSYREVFNTNHALPLVMVEEFRTNQRMPQVISYDITINRTLTGHQ